MADLGCVCGNKFGWECAAHRQARNEADEFACAYLAEKIENDRLRAELFMGEYWPGWYCSFYRCGHYRLAEENSPAWCWLRHGIGAEGRETECPAYKRAKRLAMKTPNA